MTPNPMHVYGYYVTGKILNSGQGQKYCRDHYHSDLVSIHNNAQFKKAVNTIGDSTFTATLDSGIEIRIYIRLRRGSNDLPWIDDTSFNFDMLLLKQMNGIHGMELPQQIVP